MTLDLNEKIKLVSGKNMWQTDDLEGKVKSITFSDGPHGIRKEILVGSHTTTEEATCFPTASCLACSWDPMLVSKMAKALAIEAKNNDVSILLGPAINIKRLPIAGRNFEYFSEDPYLTGILASSYITAVEDGASVHV